MRKAEPFVLFTTEVLSRELNNSLETNQPIFNYQEEYFISILNKIAMNHNIHKDQEYVAISMKKLKEELVSNAHRYLNWLKENQINYCRNFEYLNKHLFDQENLL
jgi:hypothetical protein